MCQIVGYVCITISYSSMYMCIVNVQAYFDSMTGLILVSNLTDVVCYEGAMKQSKAQC